MAEKKAKTISIKRYKNKQEFNIGMFIFAIVLIYLIVTIFSYVTKKHLAVYEVRQGSILKDNSYTGLVLREETVIPADADGYITYFVTPGSKIKAGTNVYTISPNALPTDDTAANVETPLTEKEQSALLLKTQNFNESFDAQKFSQVYSLKSEVVTALQTVSNQTRTAQLGAVLAANDGSIQVFQAPRDGVILYDFDGYEGTTVDNFTKEDLEKASYSNHTAQDSEKVAAGDSAYKLVTGERWSVIVELDEETATNLAQNETTLVKTKINKDTESMWADFSILERDGGYFGCLSYNNSMIRYAEERYLNVELILEDESGLKIPKTSVVEKNFFAVPAEYITQGGNSAATGVMRQTSQNNAEFLELDIYGQTEEDLVYLNPNDFEKGDILVKPDSAETFSLNETVPVQGVYNINKGYTVFRKVDILGESDEYYIVAEGISYGLSNYDHIVLDGSLTSEEEIIFQ